MNINENTETQNEYPENKPTNGNSNVKKVLLVTAGIIVASIFLWTAFAGGKKPGKIAKRDNDTLATPEYERDIRRNINPNDEFLKRDNSSLMPTAINGQEGLDPSQIALSTTERRPSALQNNGNAQYASNASYNPQYPPQVYNTQAPVGPPSYVSNDVKKRMDAEYQQEVDHFKGTKKFAWSVDEATYEKLKSGDQISSVEPTLKDLYEGASVQKSGFGYTIAAGSRIIAVTDQPVSTDHPGYFTSTIVRPFEIKGAKLICQAGPNQNDRIPVQPTKIVLKDKTEMAINGQIEMGFPGLEGKIKNHWIERTVPAIISAGIGGGAAAYLLNSSTPSAGETNAGNISTRDLIAGPILESSVQQVQSEVMRYSKDRPNTVLVKAGQQFSILLTDKLTIKM